MKKKPVLLMILDGFGISDILDGNAVKSAKMPNYNKYYEKYPSTLLEASGLEVGLPEGQMGNSEVGHLNIGAGRIIYQELTKINKSIKDGDFFDNIDLIESMKKTIRDGSDLHLMGLLSDGGVHSHINHLKALLKMAKNIGVKNVYIHCFLDGRDVPPSSGIDFIRDIQEYINNENFGKIATVSGRYYAMDRDNRWERIELAYNAIVLSEGEKANSAIEAVEKSYLDNKTDEFVLPTVILDENNNSYKIKDKDSVIFFNFRPDRAREITNAITQKNFDGFARKMINVDYVCMTQYDDNFNDVKIAFKPTNYDNTFGEYISSKGLNQLRIAETEKYAHVTFFFNGGVEEANLNEDRKLIPSPKVATYDLKPEMSAYEVTEKLLDSIESDKYDVIIANYANPDMVGHTGVIKATEEALEHVDTCIGKVIDKVLEKNGTVFLTSDHGNSEVMIDISTGGPMTAHTTSKVPFIYISNDSSDLKDQGRLSDIAPTLLDELEIDKPKEMTGESLIK